MAMRDFLEFGNPRVAAQRERLAFDLDGSAPEGTLLPEVDSENIVESLLSLAIARNVTKAQLLKFLDDVLREVPDTPDALQIPLAEKEKFRRYLLAVYFLKQLEVFYEQNVFTKRTYEDHMSNFVKQKVSVPDALDILLAASEHNLKTKPAYYYAVTQYLLILLEMED